MPGAFAFTTSILRVWSKMSLSTILKLGLGRNNGAPPSMSVLYRRLRCGSTWASSQPSTGPSRSLPWHCHREGESLGGREREVEREREEARERERERTEWERECVCVRARVTARRSK